jgi:hypothetical protein
MEPGGCNRCQSLANAAGAKTAESGQEPLPWVSTGCRNERMVRRGSPVRVRKRAFRGPARRGFFFRTKQEDFATDRADVCGPVALGIHRNIVKKRGSYMDVLPASRGL